MVDFLLKPFLNRMVLITGFFGQDGVNNWCISNAYLGTKTPTARDGQGALSQNCYVRSDVAETSSFSVCLFTCKFMQI